MTRFALFAAIALLVTSPLAHAQEAAPLTVAPSTPITIQLPAGAWDQVMNAMDELPGKYGNPIKDAIRQQAVQQIRALQAPENKKTD